MNICKYCLNDIPLEDIEYHNTICIYYIYNTTYAKIIPHNDIEYIITLITIFNLHKYSITNNFDINIIIKNLLLKQMINNNNIITELIKYLINLKYKFISYYDLISLMEEITHYPASDILNIINSYKVCYNNI